MSLNFSGDSMHRFFGVHQNVLDPPNNKVLNFTFERKLQKLLTILNRDTILQEISAREEELLEQVDKLVKEANTTLDGQYKQLSNLKTQFHSKVS